MANGAHTDWSYGLGGSTALHISTNKGRTKTVNLVLELGANTEVLCAYKRTPLHYAAMSGRKDIAEILIKAGAKLDAVDEEGKTYDNAVGFRRMWMAELLHVDIVD